MAVKLYLKLCVLGFVYIFTARCQISDWKPKVNVDKMRENWFRGGLEKIKMTEKQQEWWDSLGQRKVSMLDNGKANLLPRKELRQLTSSERNQYFRALRATMDTKPDPNDVRSEYMLFVEMHHFANSPAAHFGAAFLPWHREFLWRFEGALESHEPGVRIPFWDSSLDRDLPVPEDSILWSEHLMGNSQGVVTSGPFAFWPLLQACTHGGTYLHRNVATRNWLLYSDDDINYPSTERMFRDLVMYISPRLEIDHGGPHSYVGGPMDDLYCSPSDPIFWSLHAFVDRIWEDFRLYTQITDLETEYPTSADGDIGGDSHQFFAPMRPFNGMTNIQGLSTHYTSNYYFYWPRSITCSGHWQCVSDFLFCDAGRCRSMIRQGGSCQGLSSEACYGNAICSLGRCV